MPEYRYHCTSCYKTYIGVQNPGMKCNCKPQKVMMGAIYATRAEPISQELKTLVNDAWKRRGELCTEFGISNFSHKPHGANFAGNQTLLELIDDITGRLEGATRDRVKNHILTTYQYDIDTQMMA